MERSKRRSAFKAVAGGRKVSRPGFVLQALTRDAADTRAPKFGFTVTKKIGNAVVRNRIRRRLKEAVRLAAPGVAMHGTEYVLIGRRAALTLQFDQLVTDLLTGLAALAKGEAKDKSGR
jgi:ribonuclease P protein component